MLIWLLGCSIGLDPFTLSNEAGDDPEGPSDVDFVDDSDVPETSDDSPEYLEDEEEDVDEDGYSVDEGDCDDEDPTIHPAAFDDCNGIDNNCDGQIDESGAWDETGSNPVVDIGEIPSGYSSAQYGLFFPDGDTDTYRFYVSDGLFGWFNLYVELQGVPDGANPSLRLDLIEDAEGVEWGEIEYADEGGTGEPELISFYGNPWYDDSGWYEITVTAGDSSNCSLPYELLISFTD